MKAMEPMPDGLLRLSSEDLSEVKDWKVGNKYKLEVEVKMTESELVGEKSVMARFEIDKVKSL